MRRVSRLSNAEGTSSSRKNGCGSAPFEIESRDSVKSEANRVVPTKLR